MIIGVYFNRPVTFLLLFARWCFFVVLLGVFLFIFLFLLVVCLYGPVSSCALVEVW